MNFAIEVFALHLLAPAVVVGGAVGSGPVGVLEHLGDNEVLEHLPGGLVVGFDATLVGAEQMRQQPGVDQVRLRGVCLTRSDAGSPGGQQMYEEHRLQQAYVLAHGVVRKVELGGDRAIGENVRGLQGERIAGDQENSGAFLHPSIRRAVLDFAHCGSGSSQRRGCRFSSKAGTLWVGHRARSQPSKRAAGGQPRACFEAVQKPVRSGWGCLRPCATVGRLVFSYRDLHRRRRSGAISSRQMVDPGREALPPPDPVTFESPPVMQVILGVEFAGPVIAEAAVLADFWNAIREEFPEVKKQPIMQPMAENFDVAQPQQFEVRIGGPGGGPERYWIENEDRSWVVQVQPDRFALNWKRPDESVPYPRYRAVRERFQDLYGKFIAAADNQLLEENPPSWCATTYANEITHPDSTDPLHGPIDDILNFIHRPDSDVLPTVEDTWIRQRRLLRDEGGQPRGRLYIEARPTLTSPPESIPGYRLSLRIVAQPRETSDEGVLDCQDESRDLIVRSFKDITTPKMHVLWGLREEDGN